MCRRKGENGSHVSSLDDWVLVIDTGNKEEEQVGGRGR